jgi:voltage-dependent calcium channel R type alpha-1E
MVKSQKFDILILLCILISSIHLVLDNPLNDPEGKMAQGLNYLDIILAIIFALECLLKVIAYGFVFNGPESYLRSVWNIIDFTIIFCSVSSTNYILMIYYRYYLCLFLL